MPPWVVSYGWRTSAAAILAAPVLGLSIGSSLGRVARCFSYCWRVSRSSSRRSSSGSLHSAESRAISWSRCRSCSTSTASRVAFSVCCTSNSATLGVFTFTSPFWTPPGWRRFAGPGPCGLGLSRMLADGRAAVKTPKTFPPAPLKGGVGNFFCTKFAGCFWRKRQKREHLRRGSRRNFQQIFASRGGTIGGR